MKEARNWGKKKRNQLSKLVNDTIKDLGLEEAKDPSIIEGSRKASVARIESALVRGADAYLKEHGFTMVPTVPHIVNITGACENVNTLYSIDYHGKEAFLTQTGQTALEEMIVHLDRVCTTIHSFRREEEVDSRHLTEFPLIEFELKYDPILEDGLSVLLHHIEGTIDAMVKNAVKEEEDHLEMIGADIPRLKYLELPFQRIKYESAIQMLGLSWGSDLTRKEESRLMQLHGNKPLFVTHYPIEIKFFNMQQNEEDPRIVNSADLLLPPGGESVGSAVREHNYEKLVRRLDESQMMKILRERGKDIKDFDSYLSLVKDYPTPHAGCGIGLSRVMQYVLNQRDIRKATAYPMNKETL